jgi:hypothetical protein
VLHGKRQAEYEELWDRLVPDSGQAETVQGELVRVIRRLDSECERNGNGNWDRGFRMFTDFLYWHLRDPAVFDPPAIAQIERDINQVRAMGNRTEPLEYAEGEDAFDRIADRVVEWCLYYPEPIANPCNPRLKR